MTFNYEAYAFIIGSILTNFIPKKLKNFNILAMIGVCFYSVGMTIGGPTILLNVPRSMGLMFISIGIVFNGTG